MSKISLIDTHAHYNSVTMDNLEEKIKIANNNSDVLKIINVGLNKETSEEAIKISINNFKFYSTLTPLLRYF
jgi:Tat protein secretion system quality control protein TatD with DNase activity